MGGAFWRTPSEKSDRFTLRLELTRRTTGRCRYITGYMIGA